MRPAFQYGLTCGLLLALGVSTAAGAQSGRLAAVVAGQPVTVRELAGWLRVRNVDPAKATRRLWQRALDAAIDRAVLVALARRERLSVPDRRVLAAVAERRRGPTAADYVRGIRLAGLTPEQEIQRMREQLLIEELLSRKVGAKLFVAPGTVLEWYEKNKDLLAEPDVRLARVMTIEAGAAARKKITELRQSVLKGADFAELARRHSVGPWAARGGLLDPILKDVSGSVFAGRVFQLQEPGDVGEVFETKMGLHFLRLEEVRPGKTPGFKEAQGRIRSRLAEELRTKHITDLARQARRKTVVRTFWRNIPWRAAASGGVTKPGHAALRAGTPSSSGSP